MSGNMKNRKIRKRTKLCLSIKTLVAAKRLGRKVRSNQWPSSGGMGIRLNIASTKLRFTIKEKSWGRMVTSREAGKNRKVKPKSRAITILTAGPANATFAGPYFLSLRFAGLYGTGLA